MSEQNDQQHEKHESPTRYDEDLMVEWIARGQLSQSEIARRLGVNRRTVWRIANGLARLDLQRRIDAVIEGIRREARRIGAKWCHALVTKHVKVGLEGDGETARKCRQYVLDSFLFDDGDRTWCPKPPKYKAKSPEEMLSPMDNLSEECKAMRIKELGGPAGDFPSQTHQTHPGGTDSINRDSHLFTEQKQEQEQVTVTRDSHLFSGQKQEQKLVTVPSLEAGCETGGGVAVDRRRKTDASTQPRPSCPPPDESDGDAEPMPGDPDWVAPTPAILRGGDRRHREPHLFKKPILVPWKACVLAAAFLAMAVVARSDAVRRSAVCRTERHALTGTLQTHALTGTLQTHALTGTLRTHALTGTLQTHALTGTLRTTDRRRVEHATLIDAQAPESGGCSTRRRRWWNLRRRLHRTVINLKKWRSSAHTRPCGRGVRRELHRVDRAPIHTFLQKPNGQGGFLGYGPGSIAGNT